MRGRSGGHTAAAPTIRDRVVHFGRRLAGATARRRHFRPKLPAAGGPSIRLRGSRRPGRARAAASARNEGWSVDRDGGASVGAPRVAISVGGAAGSWSGAKGVRPRPCARRSWRAGVAARHRHGNGWRTGGLHKKSVLGVPPFFSDLFFPAPLVYRLLRPPVGHAATSCPVVEAKMGEVGPRPLASAPPRPRACAARPACARRLRPPRADRRACRSPRAAGQVRQPDA